ncbi:MAG: MBL fold metallo-hydrolase [Planctomycetota bacterium]
MPSRVLTILGCGSSTGTPIPGCNTDACRSDHPRNSRTRTGVLVPAPEGNFVIDTPPELRMQLVRERVEQVDAAIFTHAHADHIFGLDDLRICSFRRTAPVELCCEPPVEEALRRAFHYAFDDTAEKTHAWAVPKFAFREIATEPFEVLGMPIIPLRLMHGRLPILGFRVADVAFCSDVSEIPPETWPRLSGLDTLILGALRDKPHPTHFSIGQALEVIAELKPRRAVLTHLSCQVEYEELSSRLPDGVVAAYDGLTVPF